MPAMVEHDTLAMVEQDIHGLSTDSCNDSHHSQCSQSKPACQSASGMYVFQLLQLHSTHDAMCDMLAVEHAC